MDDLNTKQNSLQKISGELKSIKGDIKEAFKKVKCANENDQNVLNDNL